MTPEVMLIHMVSPETHDQMLLVNGVDIITEDHLDDDRHTVAPCASRIAFEIARALGVPLDERRVELAAWEALGSPYGEKLANWARTIPKPERAFSVDAASPE